MRGETNTGCSKHRLSSITLSGENVRVDVRGWSWGEMLANIQDELDIQLRDEEGTLITVSRAPDSRNRWLIHRDQVLIGSARRRWYQGGRGAGAGALEGVGGQQHGVSPVSSRRGGRVRPGRPVGLPHRGDENGGDDLGFDHPLRSSRGWGFSAQ